MKEKGNIKKLSADSDLEFIDFDLDDNLEFVVSEYEEDNFYSYIGDDSENDRRQCITPGNV